MADRDLSDYARTTFTHGGAARDIFTKGSGPAVVVIAEMPGITPAVLDFADQVAGIGCTAVLPHLFGVPGRDPSVAARGALGFAANLASAMVPACISREFNVLATGRSSPVVSWLRALAADQHERCGGPGVGAVGMCFTGGFALAMAADDRLLAPVLSQPSLPLAVDRRRRATIDIAPDELAAVQARCRSGELEVLGLRFREDRLVPAERFDFLRRVLGDAFVAVELASASANPDAFRPAHSVLTEHLVDAPGEPTRDALDRVLDLFRRRLLAPR